MADPESVVDALRSSREGRQTSLVLDRLELVAASGQDLVRIGLVADVPEQPVMRRVEHVVKRDRQLDRAQTGREMPAALGHRVDQEVTQFSRHGGELRFRQRTQVHRRVDRGEQRVAFGGGHGARV